MYDDTCPFWHGARSAAAVPTRSAHGPPRGLMRCTSGVTVVPPTRFIPTRSPYKPMFFANDWHRIGCSPASSNARSANASRSQSPAAATHRRCGLPSPPPSGLVANPAGASVSGPSCARLCSAADARKGSRAPVARACREALVGGVEEWDKLRRQEELRKFPPLLRRRVHARWIVRCSVQQHDRPAQPTTRRRCGQLHFPSAHCACDMHAKCNGRSRAKSSVRVWLALRGLTRE